MSFLAVQDKFLKAADRFNQRSWTEVHSCLPCVPFRCTACGSTCRPLEQDRPRCTNDAGAPRSACYADDIQVLSLNDAIDMGLLSLPQETKSRSLDLLASICIMHEAAAILKMQLLMATNDFASFFNQLRLAPEGLGDWIKGYYWFILLSTWHLQLHVTHLEALVATINIIVADQLLGDHDSVPADLVVCERADALVTAYMLINGRAHSPIQ